MNESRPALLLICRGALSGQTALTGSKAVCSEAPAAAGHHQPGLISLGWSHSPWLQGGAGGRLVPSPLSLSPRLPLPLGWRHSTEASLGWVRYPCLGWGRGGTYGTASGSSGSGVLIWVFKAPCEFDPLCPVSSRKPSLITAWLTLGFPFLSLLWPLERGHKPSARRGQAGNEWSGSGAGWV